MASFNQQLVCKFKWSLSHIQLLSAHSAVKPAIACAFLRLTQTMGCRQSKSPSATTCSSATDSSITVSAISTERFQIDRSLTQSLFLAHDSLKNVDCVIKRLSKSDWHSKASFIQESHIMRRLAHPNIVTMLDAIDNPKDYTMVFEFLSGKPLFQQFTRCNRSNEHKLALYCRQILQALAFCHSNDVVHRDIKPANFVFHSSDAGVLKLIDFSTAIHISDDEVHEDSFGTLPYVAPDIIEFRANHPRTGKVLKSCDMWSLGAMLFVLLTGLSPFPGQHTEDIELLIIFGQFEWPSNISLSENAKNFVERLMIVDWAARMTAEQALSHPWINESNSTNSPIEASASLDANIIQFEAISSLKKSIQNLLFKSSSDIQKHLRKMFAEFDADRDDLLDQTELTNYLEQFEPAADRYASEFISSTDAFQQRGAVTYAEFEQAHVQGRFGPDATAIRQAFQQLDSQCSGTVPLTTLRQVLTKELSARLTELVGESTGNVSFDSFIAAMTSDRMRQSLTSAHCSLSRVGAVLHDGHKPHPKRR